MDIRIPQDDRRSMVVVPLPSTYELAPSWLGGPIIGRFTLALVFSMVLACSPLLAQTATGLWVPPLEEAVLLDEIFERSPDELVAKEAEALMAFLGHPSYKQRQKATLRLIDIGPVAFPLLRDAYHLAEELEVQLRIERIIREGYLKHFVFGRNAFLGISQDANFVTHDKDRRVKKGHVGVLIRGIIADTAAEASILTKQDVIIEVDSQPILERGNQTNLIFGESIRVRGPNTLITLTILRGKQTLYVELVLKARPRTYYRGQGVVSAMFRFYSRTFDLVWAKHFLTTPNHAENGHSSS